MGGKKKKRILCMIFLAGLMGIFPAYAKGAETDELSDVENTVVTELDLGDYSEQMEVGEKQLLNVTCLPVDAVENVIIYSSSDPSVAVVNGLGRISALMPGTTSICATVGEASASFVLQVVEAESDVVPVSDIEIADHEDELYVDKTLSLSATVIPSNASNSDITYTSSDESVVTVSSTGEVKGIAKGNADIYVSTGSVMKTISLTVKVATTAIQLNRNYLVLKPDENYQLSATVIPADAAQAVTFRSADPAVASVSSGGLVTARKSGSTTVVVSNGDFSAAVSVIINQSVNIVSDETENSGVEGTEQKAYADRIQVSERAVIDSATLLQIYQNHQILQIVGNGYTFMLDGKKIVNHTNEFYTDIALSKDEDGTHFILNQEKELCGTVRLELEDIEGKYLYLYNPSKEKYEMIQKGNLEEIELTTGGVYLITDQLMCNHNMVMKHFVIAGIILLAVSGGVYAGVKKRYWFW